MKIPTGGILFFDSGIGGLTVLAETLPLFQKQIFFYYGDNDRAPYGNLSMEEIQKNLRGVFQELDTLKPRMAVLACNTATAVCAEGLRMTLPYPIIGAEPAIMPAAKNGGEVLVLATRATCKSERFCRLCDRARRLYPQVKIKAVACEGLAGGIEKNVLHGDFDPTPYLPRERPTSVVLGCTHYIYVKKKVEKFYACPVYDGNEGIAMRVHELFDKNTSQNRISRDGRPLKTPTFGLNDAKLVFNPKKEWEIAKREQIFHKKAYLSAHLESFIIDRNGNQIFFLGTQKKHNKHIFEQMFVKCRK
ncbi:MAG: aspartate/glutamate racemase family protein [Clostridia bacterium]|nr:aspartate/glutamate racemase family protein [Clostridia bacterium]